MIDIPEFPEWMTVESVEELTDGKGDEEEDE